MIFSALSFPVFAHSFEWAPEKDPSLRKNTFVGADYRDRFKNFKIVEFEVPDGYISPPKSSGIVGNVWAVVNDVKPAPDFFRFQVQSTADKGQPQMLSGGMFALTANYRATPGSKPRRVILNLKASSGTYHYEVNQWAAYDFYDANTPELWAKTKDNDSNKQARYVIPAIANGVKIDLSTLSKNTIIGKEYRERFTDFEMIEIEAPDGYIMPPVSSGMQGKVWVIVNKKDGVSDVKLATSMLFTEKRTPILLYHTVDDKNNWTYISPIEFEKQLHFLNKYNFSTLFPEEVYYSDGYKPPIVLTFNGGFSTDYTEVFPRLKEYNMKATIFLITSNIGNPEYLTEEQIKEMHDSGLVRFSSLTHSGQDLTTMSADEISNEMATSNDIIKRITGRTTDVIAYPGGLYNDTVVQIAKKYYRMGLSNWFGTDREMMNLSRRNITRETDMAKFIQYAVVGNDYKLPDKIGVEKSFLKTTYHEVSSDPEDIDRPYFIMSSTFKEQMTYYKENNYDFIMPEEILNSDSYAKPIIISLDDGYVGNYNNAFPIIKELGIKVSIFLVPSKIGESGYLDLEQIKEMQDSGLVRFYSHTYTHPRDMTLLSAEELKAEFVNTANWFEENLGYCPKVISFPRGKYNDSVLKIAKEHGYTIGFASWSGHPYNMLTLAISRYGISNDMDKFYSDMKIAEGRYFGTPKYEVVIYTEN